MTDHKAEAIRTMLSAIGSPVDGVARYFEAAAQVHATLHLADQTAALVEQHRIGNLIALGDVWEGQEVVGIRPEIREGLGL